jgi:hypothetical protein
VVCRAWSIAVLGIVLAATPAPAAIGENFSSPRFQDLDGDGVREVITTDRQSTYIFAADSSPWPGWPRSSLGYKPPAPAAIQPPPLNAAA